jgi:molybdopterin/thiamine biosynthesis adenylyltransferase
MQEKIDLLNKQLEKTVHKLSLNNPVVINMPFGDDSVKCVKLSLPPSFALYLLPSNLFPFAPPMAVMDWGGERKTHLRLDWELDNNIDINTKLFQAISKFIAGKPPYIIAYGIDASTPITSDSDIANSFSWEQLLVSSSVNIPNINNSLTDRIELGLVKALGMSSITLIGLGSVGSYMAEQLIRSGLDTITIIDPDIVEASNISRTIYTLHDINLNKTDALELRLKQINPNIRVNKFPSSLQVMGGNVLESIINKSDLVIAATDDPQAQSLINSCIFYSKVPAIFIGLYRGAKGGEVAITVPTLTPCLQCMTGLRRRVETDENKVTRNTDYGTNRLTGEIALNSDIQHVSSAALKICYSIIASLKGEDCSVTNFVPQAIAQEKHFLTMGMEPDYWFYPQIFGDSSGQYAFQSVWLTASKLDNCTVCGQQSENSETPYSHVVSTPNPGNIRNQISS